MKKILFALALISCNLYGDEQTCPEIEVLGCYKDCILFSREGHMYVATQIEHFPYCKACNQGLPRPEDAQKED